MSPRRFAARRPSCSRSKPICASMCAAKCVSIRASKALYASDASNYRQVPLAVVVPAGCRRSARHRCCMPPQ